MKPRETDRRLVGIGLISLAIAILLIAGAAYLLTLRPESSTGAVFEDAVPALELPPGPAVTASRLDRARAVSEDYWRSSRCARVHLRRAAFTGRATVARATWRLGSDGDYTRCKVTFNSRHRRLAFEIYCAAMVHEFGHLAGFYAIRGRDGGQHSANPRHVMYPHITRANVPRACKRRVTVG